MSKVQEKTHTRLHAIIDGQVQGVGFRYFVQKNAQALFLTGWVSNTSQGSVEVVAEGPQYILYRLLMFLQEGPHSAIVTALEPSWESPTNEFTEFNIR